ncbi:hypothetical protein HNR77_004111 [Paenibacillus sp. JGP012]|nr:hypothetical protein [Paenibacillus sp. JGP012]
MIHSSGKTVLKCVNIMLGASELLIPDYAGEWLFACYAQMSSSSQVRCKHDYGLMKETYILVMMFIRGTYVRIWFVLNCLNFGYLFRILQVACGWF